MRAFNSTVKLKKKICVNCGKECYWFSKKRCQDCARIEDNKEVAVSSDEEDLSYLIADLDALFSNYIRLKHSDKAGNCQCYTCSLVTEWKQQQCGHYMSRKHMFLRWDERNAKPQCNNCNCVKHGNLAAYGKRLELDHPGLTEILLEESRIIHHWTRDELRAMRAELTNKTNLLKQ